MKRKPCGKRTAFGLCHIERAPGLQQCSWHWLLKQSPSVQADYATSRRLKAQSNGPTRARVPQAEWPAGERWCSGCQSFVPLFYCQGSRCRSCNSEAAHGARIEKVYGLTPAEYDALFKLQGGRCYICRRQTKKRLAVDHNHETGVVRGLLCADSDRGCNHAILGNIRDLAMAKRIVEYLEDPPYGRLGRAVAAQEPSGQAWDPPPF